LKGKYYKKNKQEQRQFRNPLVKALLNTVNPEEEIPFKKHPYPKAMPLPNRDIQQYHWAKFLKSGYCVWCKEQAEKGLLKEARFVPGQIVNDAALRTRESIQEHTDVSRVAMSFSVKKGPFSGNITVVVVVGSNDE
jgi:hypothetical protein